MGGNIFSLKKVGSSEDDKFSVWLYNYYMELEQTKHFIKW